MSSNRGKNIVPASLVSRALPWLVWGLVLFALFWHFASNDILSDDATYSFRALGWFDYMGGSNQTAPIQWFGYIPWWGNISFHDAPPLVFAIQKAFFAVFGASTFSAKLPFVLAGLGVAVFLYSLFTRYRSREWALVALAMFAAASYMTWATRTGYLEGIEMLFVIAAFFFFLRYRESGRAQHALLFWGSAGAALCSKYTALFVVPALFLYMFVWDRDILKQRIFWFSMVAFFVVLAPVITYNIIVFQERGHPDVGLSAMMGMHPDDYRIIAQRTINASFAKNAGEMVQVFRHSLSPPFFVLVLFSLVYLAVQVIRKRADAFERALAATLFTMFCMYLFIGGNERQLSLFMPFLIAAAALAAGAAWRSLADSPRLWLRRGLAALVAGVLLWEFGYNINTNSAARPWGPPVLAWSPNRPQNIGFNQLEEYIAANILPDPPPLYRPKSTSDLVTLDIASSPTGTVVFFDETMHWFAYVWYIQRYQTYYRLPMISLSNFFKILPEDADPLAALRGAGAKDFYYFFGVDGKVVDPIKGEMPIRELEIAFANYLEENGFLKDEIRDRAGNLAFKVYHVAL